MENRALVFAVEVLPVIFEVEFFSSEVFDEDDLSNFFRASGFSAFCGDDGFSGDKGMTLGLGENSTLALTEDILVPDLGEDGLVPDFEVGTFVTALGEDGLVPNLGEEGLVPVSVEPLVPVFVDGFLASELGEGTLVLLLAADLFRAFWTRVDCWVCGIPFVVDILSRVYEILRMGLCGFLNFIIIQIMKQIHILQNKISV